MSVSLRRCCPDQRFKDLDSFIAGKRTIIDAKVDLETYEDEIQSRVSDYAISWQTEIESVQGFGDQLFVVGLWAMAEQYLTRTVDIAQRARGLTAAAPSNWPKIRKHLETVGVKVRSCKGFEDANECRVLNNKVKHLGTVDMELARFPAFADRLGQRLATIPFDLQRYSNGIFELVGFIMEEVDKVSLPSKAD